MVEKVLGTDMTPENNPKYAVATGVVEYPSSRGPASKQKRWVSKGIGNLSSISDSQPGPGTWKLCWDHRSSTNRTETEWVSTFPIPNLI
ncbi:unnamed protein product [Sphagnum troendelagicum]|uniref:Uncharacterized protein n=1 Tax=Sphagnum troendelagicum TaxID=128251 RepID=A0ABP0UJA9_9BRYO